MNSFNKFVRRIGKTYVVSITLFLVIETVFVCCFVNPDLVIVIFFEKRGATE